MYTILLAVNEPVTARYLKSILVSRGFRLCAIVSSPEEVVSRAQVLKPDIILMDIILDGDQDSIETAKSIRRESGIPVIFLADTFDPRLFELASEAEPFAFIIKHAVEESLDTAIRSAMKFSSLEHEYINREQMFRSFLSLIPGAAFRYHIPVKIIEFMSDGIEGLTGVGASSFIGGGISLLREMVHPEDRKRIEDLILKALDEHKSYTAKYRMSFPDGIVKTIRETGIVRKQDDGNMLIDGILIDISSGLCEGA